MDGTGPEPLRGEVVRLREARPDDLPELAALYAESVRGLGPALYRPEQVEAWAAFARDGAAFRGWIAGARTMVAEDASGVVGFGGVADDGHVTALYVRPDRGREGVGSLLLAELLRVGAERGATGFHAEASDFSLPLFLRFGFRVSEEERVHRGGVEFTRWKVIRGPGGGPS